MQLTGATIDHSNLFTGFLVAPIKLGACHGRSYGSGRAGKDGHCHRACRTGQGSGCGRGVTIDHTATCKRERRLRAHSKNLPIGAAEPALDAGAAEPPYATGMAIGPADPEEKGMAMGPTDPEEKGMAMGPADPPNAIGTAEEKGMRRRQ